MGEWQLQLSICLFGKSTKKAAEEVSANAKVRGRKAQERRQAEQQIRPVSIKKSRPTGKK